MAEEDEGLINVLVLDDEPDLRELYTRILLPRGHQVFAVGSAEEALQLLPFTKFQVAFVDHHLPGIEGAVLADYLFKNNPHLEIAMVTGAEQEELDRYALPKSVTIIKKPFEISAVLDRITAYQAAAKERGEHAATKDLVDFEPGLAEHRGSLAEVYAVAKIPARLEERLIHVVKDALLALRTQGRYDEGQRVVAYAGLISLCVLGIRPPKTSAGRSLFQEYDALMLAHGRAPAFDKGAPQDDQGA